MERNDEETNFLLESLRNELVSIIEDKTDDDIRKENSGKSDLSKKCAGDTVLVVAAAAHDASNINEFSKTLSAEAPPPYTRLREKWRMQPHSLRTIDDDLQSMHVNLKESYELFQTIGERFENINFGCLKSRIKDFHLTENKSEAIKTIVNDLKNSLDQGYMENRLTDLTSEIKTKFHKHPGEFGDIPELSEFFRACAQLQHGLDRLNKDRCSVLNLTTRINQSAELTISHLNEIQNIFKEKHNLGELTKKDENKE